MNVAVRAIVGLGALVAAMGACAPSYTNHAGRSEYKLVHKSGNTLGKLEMTSVNVGRNAYDVVNFLRPQFFNGRNGVPTLAVNGVLVGPATYLSTMTVNEIEEVKMLNGLDATTLFGARHTGAVLMVTTRRR
jgi:hypothetical protein